MLNISDVLHDLNQEYNAKMEELHDVKVDVDWCYSHCHIIGGPALEMLRNVQDNLHHRLAPLDADIELWGMDTAHISFQSKHMCPHGEIICACSGDPVVVATLSFAKSL